MKKLSILIPSKRPQGLENFINSLKRTTKNYDKLELVILLDGVAGLDFSGNSKIIHFPPGQIISRLLEECYDYSMGDWILIANDDVIMETQGWDEILEREIAKYPDQIALFWPDDNMLKEKLCCFPIFSRKALEIAQDFWPMPYRRYKIDDTLMEIFPASRRIYLPEIKLKHLNDEGTEGFHLGDGRIYPIDREIAEHDNAHWEIQRLTRMLMKQRLAEAVGEMQENKVFIGVPTMGFSRNDSFYDYYNQIDRPVGTIQSFARGQSPAANRNLMIRQAMEHNCSHILFLDDDIAPPPDILNKLISHDKDVVTALYLMREYPHLPIVFDESNEEKGSALNYELEPGNQGLVEITNCGLGAVLIKTKVFEKLEQPWIRLGQLKKDEWGDDIEFFNRVRRAGFRMYCDLSVHVGHFGNVIVRPMVHTDGSWLISYNTNGSETVVFPVPKMIKHREPVNA